MKFILFALCLLFGKYTNAQSFNLENLEKLVHSSIENFDSSVSEKGFTYLKTDEYLKTERTSYELNDELIAIGFHKEFTQLFLATDVNTYKLIKGSLIQNHFIYNGKKVSDLGSMIFTYKKLNVEVYIIDTNK